MWKILFTLGLAGCSTTSFYKDTLQADGKTWEVIIENASLCGAMTSEDVCVDRIRPEVVSRGATLCGAAPKEVLACGMKRSREFGAGVGCIVRC